MFGILRPCRNRLGEDLRAAWTAHLCGLCLALRDEHGHLARLVTNYDALIVSALVEAQLVEAQQENPHRRDAGPCALRGMRRASVATGDGARLAAGVSLLLAAARLGDHVADGDLDGALRTRTARRVAQHWAAAGTATGTALGLDTAALTDVVARQAAAEATGRSIQEITAPTEDATAAAFAHTATVAGRPGNAAPLAEAGRLFGRLAHLLDAVEDLHADHAAGTWNPILATGHTPAQVRRHCDDALLGVDLALRDAEFTDDRLVHALLVHELDAAVGRAFAAAGQPAPRSGQPPPYPPSPFGWEAPPPAPPVERRKPLTGCLGWLAACGTCQVCCAGEYTDPCTGKRREGLCRGANCDCDCGGCDDCCDCCDCCDCGC